MKKEKSSHVQVCVGEGFSLIQLKNYRWEILDLSCEGEGNRKPKNLWNKNKSYLPPPKVFFNARRHLFSGEFGENKKQCSSIHNSLTEQEEGGYAGMTNGFWIM
jgi:hypothetical protein